MLNQAQVQTWRTIGKKNEETSESLSNGGGIGALATGATAASTALRFVGRRQPYVCDCWYDRCSTALQPVQLVALQWHLVWQQRLHCGCNGIGAIMTATAPVALAGAAIYVCQVV